MEVASTSSYQLQLQQLQAEEATVSAMAAADSKQAELQAALESLQQASGMCTVQCRLRLQPVSGEPPDVREHMQPAQAAGMHTEHSILRKLIAEVFQENRTFIAGGRHSCCRAYAADEGG